MVSHPPGKQKGLDVNVAAQLLLHVLGGAVNGALAISNDSDLRSPAEQVSPHVQVGVVNPARNYLAGARQPRTSGDLGRPRRGVPTRDSGG